MGRGFFACRETSTRFSKMQAFLRGNAAPCVARAKRVRLWAEKCFSRGTCPREKGFGPSSAVCGRRNSARLLQHKSKKYTLSTVCNLPCPSAGEVCVLLLEPDHYSGLWVPNCSCSIWRVLSPPSPARKASRTDWRTLRMTASSGCKSAKEMSLTSWVS